jgi:hypothetical protein
VWQQEEFQSAAENEICTEVRDLARSTKTDKQQNTFGLDENVLLIIFKYLGVRDVGRASQTCKTWRRICLTERLWKGVAESLGISCKENDSYRSKTIEHVDYYIRPDFVYLPDDLEEERTPNNILECEKIPIVMLSLLHVDSGPGKTTLRLRFTNNVFVVFILTFFFCLK